MYPLPDLRTRTDQCMAVDHCAFIDVCAGVYEHRRHAHNAGSDVCPVSNARSAWHNAHPIGGRKPFDGISMLVEKLKAAVWR